MCSACWQSRNTTKACIISETGAIHCKHFIVINYRTSMPEICNCLDLTRELYKMLIAACRLTSKARSRPSCFLDKTWYMLREISLGQRNLSRQHNHDDQSEDGQTTPKHSSVLIKHKQSSWYNYLAPQN